VSVTIKTVVSRLKTFIDNSNCDNQFYFYKTKLQDSIGEDGRFSLSVIRCYEPFFFLLSYGVIKEIKLQILQSQTLRILIIFDMFCKKISRILAAHLKIRFCIF